MSSALVGMEYDSEGDKEGSWTADGYDRLCQKLISAFVLQINSREAEHKEAMLEATKANGACFRCDSLAKL